MQQGPTPASHAFLPQYTSERISPGSLHSPEEAAFLPQNGRHIHCRCRENIKTIPLHDLFLEERAQETKKPEHYLNSAQRAQYLIEAKEGLFLNQSNQPLNGIYLYVMLPNHKLYAAKEVRNHSHLSAGLNVLAAGYLYVKEGTLINFSNNSGHYKPSIYHFGMRHAIEAIWKMADNPELCFEDHSQAPQSIIDFYKVQNYLFENTLNPLSTIALEETLKVNEQHALDHKPKTSVSNTETEVPFFGYGHLLKSAYAYSESGASLLYRPTATPCRPLSQFYTYQAHPYEGLSSRYVGTPERSKKR